MFATTPITLITPLRPASFVVLDLETGDAPEDAIESAIAAWKAPSNWKPETAAAKRQEAAEKIRERAALLDASPILCIAIQTDLERTIFNGMSEEAPTIEGWKVIGCGGEAGMMRALRAWMNAGTTPETVIVGHNARAFDMPKLRNAYVRHGLRLPELLKPRLRDEDKAELVDTSSLFKAFSMEHRDDFCPSLDAVAASFGIQRPKQHMSGADCPRLFKEGRFVEVLTYCAI
ncbi:MAG: ribonuclease H-like domain-containing protein, partial [Candidatus Competibacter sp.]|nr:ribonuclease H-like domain-containing protein [Candidatus Competibacter sp.]